MEPIRHKIREHIITNHKKAEELKYDNISKMFFRTSLSMIFTELVGVVAVFIDGIITSHYIGIDAYSGISLLGPFTSILLVIAGFLSTGSMIVCSRFIGEGKREEANEVLNLSILLSIVTSLIFILTCIFAPNILLKLCGVNVNKYPELNPHMYGYLNGYMFGIPALILIQVIGPIIVMDSGKKIFSISSLVLCLVDIGADLLNAFVFHGGAFGMGLATSISYTLQLLLLVIHFARRNSYYRFSFKYMKFKHLGGIFKNGTPALIKKIAGALRDIFLNYINIMFALTAAAIAARGIQSDMFKFLFCIPTGLGRTLITMAGIYYSARDMKGLRKLYIGSFRIGSIMSAVAGVIAFFLAPVISGIYTDDPEVLSLAVFSIRWMSVALVFDTVIVLIQHYLQGTDNLKRANILSFCERFVVPVITAFILGMLYGSKGILASVAVGKMILLLGIFVVICIRSKGFPKKTADLMFLPEGFGGKEEDNMYAAIRTMDDVMVQSGRTKEFCLSHGVSEAIASQMSLFVEEMAKNVIEYAEQNHDEYINVDFRLYVEDGELYISMMDLGDLFDPTAFYELNKDNKEHIGIRMVTNLSDEMRYFSTFNSNNLVICMHTE